MKYNWELPDWPNFTFELSKIEPSLYAVTVETGEVSGILKSLPQEIQQEALLQLMLSEAIKTSEIEGEYLSRQDVMSSLRNNLGMNNTIESVHDKKALGIGELMVAVRRTYAEPLTAKMLWGWHKLLLSSSKWINTDAWRQGDEPMQVIISGRIGKEKVHFQAPPSDRVAAEMTRFLRWFNATAPGGKQELNSASVRSAIAHLYFASIHPFEDGNGRIGRAIAEKALSQTLRRPVMMSLSKTIEADKNAYYSNISRAQRSNVITEWIAYFAAIILKAQREAKELAGFILQKASFFDRYKDQLNARQMKVAKRMFDAGVDGFEGGMTARKYMSISGTSKATATRDLLSLCALGVLRSFGGGRNIHYQLNIGT